MTPEIFWTIAIISHLGLVVSVSALILEQEISQAPFHQFFRFLYLVGVVYTWVSVFV